MIFPPIQWYQSCSNIPNDVQQGMAHMGFDRPSSQDWMLVILFFSALAMIRNKKSARFTWVSLFHISRKPASLSPWNMALICFFWVYPSFRHTHIVDHLMTSFSGDPHICESGTQTCWVGRSEDPEIQLKGPWFRFKNVNWVSYILTIFVWDQHP